MARQNIEHLRRPHKRWNLPHAQDAYGQRYGFETWVEAEAEDLKRADLLESADLQGELEGRAEALAARLRSEDEEDYATPASRRYLREPRRNTAGALWELADRTGLEQVRLATLVPAGWRFTANELMRADAIKLLNGVRSDLNRVGAAQATGALFLYIDGEFDPATNHFQLHLHGLATKGMIRVVNRLRKRRKYQPRRSELERCERPIVMRWKLQRLPYRLTYLVKAMWWSRSSEPVITKKASFDDHAKPKAKPRKRGKRIAEPYHSLALLWLDRWRLQDLSVLVHLQVQRGRLVATR